MVGRTFAGIMGTIAFVATQFRGVLHDASLEATVTAGCGWLVVFAGLGFLAGTAGQVVMGDAVRVRFHQELSERDGARARKA